MECLALLNPHSITLSVEETSQLPYQPSKKYATVLKSLLLNSFHVNYSIIWNKKSVNLQNTKNNPYTIEKESGLFGSYVKLDNDIWRIYQVNDTEIRLILNN